MINAMSALLIQCVILGSGGSNQPPVKIQRNLESLQLSVAFPNEFPNPSVRGEVPVTDAYEDRVALNVYFGSGRIRVLKKKEYVNGQKVDFFPGVSHFPDGPGREIRIELECMWNPIRE